MIEEFSFCKEKYLLIGKIGKPHGLRGELRLVSYSGQPENLEHYHQLYLVNSRAKITPPLVVERIRSQGKHPIVKFAAINDRSGADEVVGAGVLVARSDLPAADDGEYYWDDFIGKRLVNRKGDELGVVRHIFNNGAQDILVAVKDCREYLIPVTKTIVVEVKEDALLIDPPPGLFELNEDLPSPLREKG